MYALIASEAGNETPSITSPFAGIEENVYLGKNIETPADDRILTENGIFESAPATGLRVSVTSSEMLSGGTGEDQGMLNFPFASVYASVEEHKAGRQTISLTSAFPILAAAPPKRWVLTCMRSNVRVFA
jgi:hypothetical protein